MRHLLPPLAAGRIAAAVLLAVAAAGLPHGDWGHARWTREGIHATVPTFAEPRQTMLLTAHGNPPMGWLVPFFPAEVAVVALGGGFPESDAYRERTFAMMAERRGPVYVMLTAEPAQPDAESEVRAAERNAAVLEAARAVLERYRLAFDPAGCAKYPARVGSNLRAYQLCPVAKMAAP